MVGWNDGSWEVPAAFFPVFCEELVFNEENEKKFITLASGFFWFYICPQFFSTIRPLKNGCTVKTISHVDTMSAEKQLYWNVSILQLLKTPVLTIFELQDHLVIKEAERSAIQKYIDLLLNFRVFKDITTSGFQKFYD